MQVLENYDLKSFNTFGIAETARFFSRFAGQSDLEQLLTQQATMISATGAAPMILGGGSNILLTGTVNRFVLKNEIKGINIIKEDTNHVYVKAGGGENWHQFVLFCLEHNLAGVENLSLIPGNVGASPMQNIGAYGVEIKDVFEELEAYDLREGRSVAFSANDCEFGYRESVFKRKYKDRFVILEVTFRLSKKPVFHTEYGAIRQELEKMGVQDLSIQAISQAVINIRSSKLPDPARIGNAGSFFKNPTVPMDVYETLIAAFPKLVAYPVAPDSSAGKPSDTSAPAEGLNLGSGLNPASGLKPAAEMKLAAGWLIEQAGWKGYRKGDAGCHAQQALVLLNYGNARGKEIYDLSIQIVESVKEKFGVVLEREVNLV